MIRHTILAGAAAGLLAALVATPATATPLPNSPGASHQGIVDQVRGPGGRGGPGGFRGGGGGGGPRFHGGGGGPRLHGGGRGPGRHYGGGGRHYGGGGHHHGPRRFRGYGFGAYPFYGYGGSYYYGGSSGYGECGYLRRRALATGSRYWWNRYYDCIDD